MRIENIIVVNYYMIFRTVHVIFDDFLETEDCF